MQLLADGSKLTPSVQKEAAKAGDAGAKTLGQRLSSGLKTNGLKVFGTVAAAAFGLAAKGALQLEDAAARVRAETGATADEAKAAAKAINAAAGSEQASLEAVTDAAIKVRRDLGATGDEADVLTKKFTRFARVTRQDAAAAVADFDDILDAWSLPASASGDIMDKLVRSGQKYGGVITEDQKALAAMAPQLKAFNLGIDDGIALLDLFKVSGVDAASIPRALNSAIQKLDGRPLEDFVKELAAIEDPGERARRAIEIFGARAGVNLANAIKPGMDSLDDFKITTEEAAGATDAAADVLDSTWGGRFKKLMSEAGAAIRGLGADFGVALSALGALGSVGTALGLDRLLAKAFGKVAGSALVKGAASKAGLVVGAVFSGAMFVAEQLGGAFAGALGKLPGAGLVKSGLAKAGAVIGRGLAIATVLGFAAVVLVMLVDELNKVVDGIKAQLAAIGKDIGVQIASGTTEALLQSKGALEAGLAELDKVWDLGIFSNDARDKLQAQLDAVNAALALGAARIPQSVADGVAAGVPAAQSGLVARARELLLPMLGALKAATVDAYKTAGAIPNAIAAGIHDRRETAKAAFDGLVELLKHPLSKAKEGGRLLGYATSKALIKGLRSNDPEIRASAQGAQQIWLAELAQLAREGATPGKKAMAKLERDLKSGNPAVRAAAQAAKKAIDEGLVTQTGKSPGDVVGDALVADLKDKDGAIYKAGHSLGGTFARGIVDGVRGKSAPKPSGSAGGKRGSPSYDSGSWSVPTTGPATVHQAEIIVPRTPADAIRSGAAVLTAGGIEPAGTTINVGGLSIDASGQANPAATAAAVERAVEDGMARVLRNQSLRYAGSTRR